MEKLTNQIDIRSEKTHEVTSWLNLLIETGPHDSDELKV